MSYSFRRFVGPVALTLLASTLAACGGGGGGGSSSSNNNSTGAGVTVGTPNSVVATPSSAQGVQAAVGGTTTVSVSFTTSDGRPASNVQATNLASLPAGWSTSSGSFGCSQVSSGNGCLLSLTFAPTTASSGTLTVDFTYSDNSGTGKTGTVSFSYSSTTHDNVIAAASPVAPYAVVAGSGSQAVTVHFTTDDGNPATNLQLTTNLAALASGWSSSVASFSCATVSSGNGCALPLAFRPTAATSGTLTLAYSYVDNSGSAKTGSINLPYAATTHNHVVGTASPNGPISVGYPGGSQVVTVSFVTDDGNPATNLAAGLTGLPTGWTSAATSFACARVTASSGCQLQLTYTPTALATNLVLPVNFTYLDDSGSAGTGSVQITYSAVGGNNAVATVSPASPISAVAGGAALPVSVSFTTDNGQPATNLHITGPSSLPANWSGNLSSFTCPTFSTGNGCQLALSYASSASDSGSLQLNFAYTSGSGATKTGSTTIAYSATTHNVVTGVVSPTGQVVDAVNGTAVPVTVTFNTGDANTAKNLTITGGLTPLAGGWTGPTSFSCATVPSSTGGTGCRLSLSFAPTTAGGGTLALGYGYTDNANTAQTGTVNISYNATSNNNVVATVSPGGTITTATNTALPVYVTFNTDDANNALSLQVTGGLTGLPAGWSAPASFTCASIAHTGSACQLTLTFDPTTAVSGTIAANTLAYSYTSNSGAPKTGMVSTAIPYASSTGHVYIADGGTTGGNKVVNCAVSATTGALSGCTTAYALANLDPRDVVLNGSRAYISARINGGSVYVCTINADSTFSNCLATGSGFSANHGIAINGNFLYAANTGGFISVCAINATDGTLSNCAATAGYAAGGSFENVPSPAAIAFSGSKAFIADELWDGGTNSYGSLIACTVEVSGVLDNCSIVATGVTSTGGNLKHNSPLAVLVDGANLVVGFPGGLDVCPIGVSLQTACTSTGPGIDAHGLGLANGFAYIGENDTAQAIWVCPESADTVSATCTAQSGTGILGPEMMTFH